MQPSGSDPHRSTRRLFVWFLLTTIVPAGALAWLGWMLVEQDRRSQREARTTARDHAVELAAAALQRTLAELEEQLSTFALGETRLPGNMRAEVAVVTFTRDALVARAGRPLPFHPVPARQHPAPGTVHEGPPSRLEALDQADALEFVAEDHAGALHVAERLTRSDDAQTRGEALLRVARLSRKLRRLDAALDAYRQLAALDQTIVAGQPAGLAAAQGRGLLLSAAGRRAELAEVAGELLRALDNGQWPLERQRYEFAREQAAGWQTSSSPSSADRLGATVEQDDDRVALALAAEAVWNAWRRGDASATAVGGRTASWVHDRSVLALTRGSASQISVMLVGPRFFDDVWRGRSETPGTFALALTDAEGRTVIGDPHVPLDRQSSRSPSATNLPWTVHVVDLDDTPAAPLSRQALLMLAALGVMMSVVAAGGYVITRTLARELRVGRLQSDFVAAVSHEFRTPLTTVRHLSELLARGRVSTDERRAEFYGILVRESDRLQRLIESLLNFARLESGELEYRFEPVSPGEFIRDLVNDFREEVAGRDVRLTLAGDAEKHPAIRADREVLARVFWNLLDNAVKYSPDGADVHVSLASSGTEVVVTVRDRGIGIPAAEQRQIFQKFVRGEAAKAASIKGTGIGLAMAREIVRAHGGDVTVESREGAGSTFIVRLPVAAALPATAQGTGDAEASQAWATERAGHPKSLEHPHP